jgi:hypothetical protein
MHDDGVVEWLLAGDPAIRWQVMRDLLDAPRLEWEAERARTVETGWVAELLSYQGRDGEWPKGRWTASTWTLLLLVGCGLPEEHPCAGAPLERLLERFMPRGEETEVRFLLERVDLCHLGFWLGLGAYFLPGDPRLRTLAEAVLSAQFADGGWNCHMRNYPDRTHSSFNTTFNILENLRIAAEQGTVTQHVFQEAEARAAEFMLTHRLYRSDKTGEVIAQRFTHLTHPWHWHYTVLRGLDYMRLTDAIHDERLDDPTELLLSRRKANGRWPLQKRIPGTLLVEMEKPGGESRWNTLRMLRILRRRDPVGRAQSTGYLAAVEDVDLSVGECEVELDVADVGILADDVRQGSSAVVRLGLRLERQSAVGGLGVPRLLA